MLESYKKLSPKPMSLADLKIALQDIWDELPQNAIQKAICTFASDSSHVLALKVASLGSCLIVDASVSTNKPIPHGFKALTI